MRGCVNGLCLLALLGAAAPQAPAQSAGVPAPATPPLSVAVPDTTVRLLRRMEADVDTLVARGRTALGTGTPAGRAGARDDFLAVIQLAPGDVRGYIGVSDTYFRGLRITQLPPEWTASAIAFAQKAVARAPENAAAHFALAIAYFRQFWFGLCIEHLLRAWALEPSADVAYWLGWMYSEVGRLEELLPWLERAQALDPSMERLAAELG
jgi:hypothetical protein